MVSCTPEGVYYIFVMLFIGLMAGIILLVRRIQQIERWWHQHRLSPDSQQEDVAGPDSKGP